MGVKTDERKERGELGQWKGKV